MKRVTNCLVIALCLVSGLIAFTGAEPVVDCGVCNAKAISLPAPAVTEAEKAYGVMAG